MGLREMRLFSRRRRGAHGKLKLISIKYRLRDVPTLNATEQQQCCTTELNRPDIFDLLLCWRARRNFVVCTQTARIYIHHVQITNGYELRRFCVSR